MTSFYDDRRRRMVARCAGPIAPILLVAGYALCGQRNALTCAAALQLEPSR